MITVIMHMISLIIIAVIAIGATVVVVQAINEDMNGDE